MGCAGYFGPSIRLPGTPKNTGPRETAVWEKHFAGEIDIHEAYRRQRAIANEASMPDMIREKQEQMDRMFANVNPRARAPKR